MALCWRMSWCEDVGYSWARTWYPDIAWCIVICNPLGLVLITWWRGYCMHNNDNGMSREPSIIETNYRGSNCPTICLIQYSTLASFPVIGLWLQALVNFRTERTDIFLIWMHAVDPLCSIHFMQSFANSKDFNWTLSVSSRFYIRWYLTRLA